MMTKEEFYEDIRNVCSRVRERCEKIYAPLLKNSTDRECADIIGNCLSFTQPEEIDEFYSLYLDGYTLENIHETIEFIGDVLLKPHDAAMEIINIPFEEIKDRIICLVFSNEEHRLIQEIQVFDDYTYFKALYYVDMEQDKEGETSMMVPILSEHLKKWGKDRDDIFEAAIKNQEKHEILLTTLDDYCGVSLQELNNYNYYDGKTAMTEPDLEKAFVLTSASFHYAVSLILNDAVLSHIYKIFKGNYYVLPGSIHEALIIPDREGLLTKDILDCQCRLYQEAEALLDEMITDEVFYYDGKDGQLIRININDEKTGMKENGSRKEIIIQHYERASA